MLTSVDKAAIGWSIGIVAVFIGITFSLQGLQESPQNVAPLVAEESETMIGDTRTQIANPASTYCIENGGTLTVQADDKGIHQICTLPDGIQCEEWSYFRGECP